MTAASSQAVPPDLLSQLALAQPAGGSQTRILGASVRTPKHVQDCAMAGADVVTVPPALFLKLLDHPLTKAGLETFAADWASTGQNIA